MVPRAGASPAPSSLRSGPAAAAAGLAQAHCAPRPPFCVRGDCGAIKPRAGAGRWRWPLAAGQRQRALCGAQRGGARGSRGGPEAPPGQVSGAGGLQSLSPASRCHDGARAGTRRGAAAAAADGERGFVSLYRPHRPDAGLVLPPIGLAAQRLCRNQAATPPPPPPPTRAPRRRPASPGPRWPSPAGR